MNALDAFVKGAPKKAKSVDDEAVAAFVRAVPEASKQTRDALTEAKKALDEMHQEQKLLREYVGDAAMQIPEILIHCVVFLEARFQNGVDGGARV